MATELGLLSQNLQKLAQQEQQQRHQLSTWSYTSHRRTIDGDGSWEVRAFAEDAPSAMGTTWPPRSYTCTFCQREFRSAQALGGHMNVHRRDRARLQQFPQGSNPSPSSLIAGSSPPMVFSSPEFITSGGLCLLYPTPRPGSASTSATADLSTLLSISPYPGANFPVASPLDAVPLLDKVGMARDINAKGNGYVGGSDNGVVKEEMDLELRLGW